MWSDSRSSRDAALPPLIPFVVEVGTVARVSGEHVLLVLPGPHGPQPAGLRHPLTLQTLLPPFLVLS